jgi:hypothetical protein
MIEFRVLYLVRGVSIIGKCFLMIFGLAALLMSGTEMINFAS